MSKANVNQNGVESRINIGIGQEKVGEGIICDSRRYPLRYGALFVLLPDEFIVTLRGLQAKELNLPTFGRFVSLPLCKMKHFREPWI